MNKYLEGEESSDSDTDWDEDIDIHEIVRSGTLQAVKEALARDRPRLIALKNEVSLICVCAFIFSMLSLPLYFEFALFIVGTLRYSLRC